MRLGLRTSALACAVASLVCVSSRAAVIPVQDSLDDFEPQHNSSTGAYVASENFNTGSRVGFQTNFNGTGAGQPGGITSAYFFQLPSLAPGETISNATFSVGRIHDSATAAITPTFNADLYALGVVSPVSKTVADAQKFFYVGSAAQGSLPAVDGAGAVTGSVSRLVDNFLTPNDFIANSGADSATPTTGDITSYIQNLYANPAANGFTPGTSYLVLRLNPDTDVLPTTGTQRYTTAFQGTAANGGAGSAENRPLITLTTTAVPEPASAGVLLVVGTAWLRRRRKA